MKIGIITFHRAQNLGAVLQAYALCTYMNEHICETELIDFYPNNAVPQASSLIRRAAHLAKAIIRLREAKQRKIKTEKFDAFMAQYRLSPEHYYGDQAIMANPPKYDLLISGGDQILNTTLSGCSESFYLSFDNTTPKISYSSSFGRQNISEDEKRLIRQQLSKFKALSVREATGADIIEAEISVRPKVVMDPVFLLSRERWASLCAAPRAQGKYIFIYAMENTPELRKAVVAVREKYQLPLLTVYGGKCSMPFWGEMDACCGPQDFLSHIRNAEIIVTNSFHGTAFALIFGKMCYVVAHSNRNARLTHLLNVIGDVDKLITSLSTMEYVDSYKINGACIGTALNVIIESSKEYLFENVRL